jgi:putative IMPACT (imprinted ancient) family translation regulator
LVRAYGEAASAVLGEVGFVEETLRCTLVVHCDYRLDGPLQGVAARHGAEVVTADYAERVRLTLSVPTEGAEALVEALVERAAGRIDVERRW